jgi:flagellar biosynthesis/type III secretory pathway protein FliH
MSWISGDELKRLQDKEKDYSSQTRVHKKELRELKREHRDEIDEVIDSNKTFELENKELRRTVDSLKKLETDATAVKTLKLKLEEQEKLIKQREDNNKDREKELEEEQSKHYKSGYEDGVADGLRKGYDLTADDRQNMAMVAALAAASHSDGATQKIAEEIVKGMATRHALPTGKKK